MSSSGAKPNLLGLPLPLSAVVKGRGRRLLQFLCALGVFAALLVSSCSSTDLGDNSVAITSETEQPDGGDEIAAIDASQIVEAEKRPTTSETAVSGANPERFEAVDVPPKLQPLPPRQTEGAAEGAAEDPTESLVEEVPVDSPATETEIAPEFTTPLGEAIRYVNGVGGDDGASGTSPEQAWRTLGAALDRLQVGMTLFVMDGVYNEHLHGVQGHYVINGLQGSPDQWTRVLNMPGHRPKIEVTKATGLEVINSSYVEVAGFEIEGVGFSGDMPMEQRRKPRGILGVEGHHFYFHDLVVHGLPHSGIAGGLNTSHFRIENNLVYDNALWSDEGGSGISLWRLSNVGGGDDADGYSNYIVGNTMYRNENRERCGCVDYRSITDGNGIIIDQSKINDYQGRTLIAANVAFNNGGRAINIHESGRVDIFNNTSYHNSFTAELDGPRAEIAAYNSFDVQVQNNLLWPSAGLAHIFSNSEVGSTNNLYVGAESGQDGANLLVTDPLVATASTDPEIADFRPLNGSPALGAGTEGRTIGAYQNG